MKKMKAVKFIILFFIAACIINLSGKAQEDSVVKEELVKLQYFNANNKMQYLLLESVWKEGKKTEPQPGKSIQLYLDSVSSENLVASVKTDNEGKAKSFIPVSLKAGWEASPLHTFIAVAAPDKKDGEEKIYEFEIAKAKISLDTLWEDGVRSITVLLQQYVNDEWIPAPEVEMKVGVLRLGGILTAGEEETYTTDSAGIIKVEFKSDSLPGDEKGNIMLVAKVENNDQFGNLLIEKKAGWGYAVTPDNTFFDQRTLWSTRFKTPFWLLFMAYSIVIGVWGTILYLVFQIIKIKKLGSAINY